MGRVEVHLAFDTITDEFDRGTGDDSNVVMTRVKS